MSALVLLVGTVSLVGPLGAAGSAGVRSGGNPDNVYGPLPKWLPTSTAPVDRVLVGSARHPRLSVEGSSVEAVLAHGRALVTVVGPTVPPFVAPPPPRTTTTFTVTMTRASGTVPIRAADFELVDGNGQLYTPRGFDGAAPARRAPKGRAVSFRITEVMATGAGSIRWSPGGRPVAVWDFVVEND